MLYKKLIFALIVGVYSQAAHATEEVLSICNTCEIDQQYMSHARSLVSTNETIITNIFNMPKFGYKKYRVSKTSYIECEYDQEPDGRGGKLQICRQRYKYSTKELAISNQELSDFTDLALAYNDAEKYFLSRSIEIPEVLTSTAFNLINNTYTQGKVVYYFNNNVSFQNSYREKFQAIVGASSKVANNLPTVNAPPLVFSFSDGTKGYAVLHFIDSDGQYHFKFIKIKDGHNSIDLELKQPLSGRYTFINMSQKSWEAFFSAMKSLGLTIRGAKESIIPTGTVTIVAVCGTGEVCPNPE